VRFVIVHVSSSDLLVKHLFQTQGLGTQLDTMCLTIARLAPLELHWIVVIAFLFNQISIADQSEATGKEGDTTKLLSAFTLIASGGVYPPMNQFPIDCVFVGSEGACIVRQPGGTRTVYIFCHKANRE